MNNFFQTVADESVNPFDEPFTSNKYVPANHIILQSVTVESTISARTGDVVKHESGSAKDGPRALFIGSYTPRRCGLAKFLEDLTNAYPAEYGVVAVDEDSAQANQRSYPDDVVFRLKFDERESYYKLAEIFNEEPYDVVNIQHEYGLYGGMAGEYILAFMGATQKPIITTMHT